MKIYINWFSMIHVNEPTMYILRDKTITLGTRGRTEH